jgi:hypothetical protein
MLVTIRHMAFITSELLIVHTQKQLLFIGSYIISNKKTRSKERVFCSYGIKNILILFTYIGIYFLIRAYSRLDNRVRFGVYGCLAEG